MMKMLDLLAGNMRTDDPFKLRQTILANVFIFLSLAVLFIFFFLNYFVFHDIWTARLDVVSAMLSLYALYKVRIQNNLQDAIVLNDVNLFLFFLAYAYINKNDDFGLIWLVFVPMFMISLNGYRRGLIITAFFYAILFPIAYLNIGVWQNGEWNLHSFVRFSMVSILMTYVAYINEISIYKTNLALKRMREKEREYNALLEQLSYRDELTGVRNRRAIQELFEKNFERARTDKRYRFSLVMVDIDHFKRINDTYGHQQGDRVLKRFCEIMESRIREGDMMGRWGGEEFLMIFPGCDLEDAVRKAEMLRQTLEAEKESLPVPVTASFGVTEYRPGDTRAELLHRVDEALYGAKAAGRNRVEAL